MEKHGPSDYPGSSNSQERLARHQRPTRELQFEHAINNDIKSSGKPSSSVYERPKSSEYEYPKWPHAHHAHFTVHKPISKTEMTEDAASDGYFAPYLRSPEDKYENGSLRYQSLIHCEGNRKEEEVMTKEKGEGDEMSYVIMPEDLNTSGQNSLNAEPKQRNILTHESSEGQQEHHAVGKAKTMKTENSDVDGSDVYFTPLVRLPENTYGDSQYYQSLIHKGKIIEEADMAKDKGEKNEMPLYGNLNG